MRRRGDLRAFFTQGFQNRRGERRPFHGVGARAQLVEQDEAAAVRLPDHADDVRHMRGKSAERLLDALLVPDIRQHLVEHGNLASVPRRDHQAAHRHQRQKADRLERDGLAAGIRPGDDERVERIAELDIHGHDLLRVDQRVARPPQHQLPPVVHGGHHRLHPVGELPLRKDHVQADGGIHAFKNTVGKAAHLL